MTRPTISFEFFPPKNEDGAQALWQAMKELSALGPAYMTVTYGAGGSTKDGTLETLKRAVAEFPGIPFASHLTFLSTQKADLDPYIDALWESGVKTIVALRGDLPKGARFEDFAGDEYYRHTSEFVGILKQKHPFQIIVGAYPEKHPDAPSLEADIEALRLKCAAGADRVTTQFFFDNEVYFRFVEKCEKAGITIPINPGLIPIHDFAALTRFAARCQASIPAWLHEKFEGLEDKPEEARKIATDLLILQSEDLAARGIPHIHYYALNKSPITREACEALGYRADAA